MSAHSLLSASASTRITTCPQSVMGPPSAAGEAAAEGTVLHGQLEKLGLYGEMSPVGTVAEQEGYQIELTEERLDLVRLTKNMIDRIKWVGKPSYERTVHYGEMLGTPHALSFGTADLSGWEEFTMPEDAQGLDLAPYLGKLALSIGDAKFGYNTVLPESLQLTFYAAGVVQDTERNIGLLPLNTPVVQRIFQPRQRSTARVHVLTVGKVKAIMARHAPAAQAAVRFYQGTATEADKTNFPEVTGDHCKYCGRKSQCKTFNAMMKRAATGKVAITWDATTQAIFAAEDAITHHLAEIKAEAARLHKALGTPPPGTKLIAGGKGRPKLLGDEALWTQVADKAGILGQVRKASWEWLTPAKFRDALKAADVAPDVLKTVISQEDAPPKLVPLSEPGEALTSAPSGANLSAFSVRPK